MNNSLIMSKTLETKEKILERLKSGKTTVADLSRELGLAKSTVSQHLSELERAGAVFGYEDQYFKRLKYFEINPAFDMEKAMSMRRPASALVKFSLGAIAIIAFLVSMYGSYAYQQPGQLSGTPLGSIGGSAMVPCCNTTIVLPPTTGAAISPFYIAVIIMAIIAIEAIWAFRKLQPKQVVITKERIGILVCSILYAMTVFAVFSWFQTSYCYPYTNMNQLGEYAALISLVVVSAVSTHVLLGEKPKRELAMILAFMALIALAMLASNFFNPLVACPMIAISNTVP